MLSAKPIDVIDAELAPATDDKDANMDSRMLGLDLLVNALSAALERQTRQSPMDKHH
jgi:hypothetical protein